MNRRSFLQQGLKTAAMLPLVRTCRLRALDAGDVVESLWSGALTSTSIRVNARVRFDSDDVVLVVSTAASFTNPRRSAPGRAQLSSNNRMVALGLGGLQPDTAYFYTIEVDGQRETAMVGRFRTPPDGPFSFTIATAACAATKSNHPVFDTIRQHNPLFFLHMGDLHYEDIPVNNRDRFRAAFDRVLAAPRQAALYRSAPIAYMWDDHDYGPNNSDKTAPGREAARLTYQEYVPHYPLVAGSGNVPIYQAFTIGRVRFILTDTRSERDTEATPDTPAKTMLGSAQKVWLKQELLAANGRFPVIVWVCTSPWIADPPGSGFDNWAGFANERREIADFIQANAIAGVVFVSGDVHMLGIDDGSNNRYASNGRAGFPVLQAAALDRPNPTFFTTNTYSEGQYPGSGQFALMRVEDDGTAPVRVEWLGLNAGNEEVVRLEMTFPPSPRLDVEPDQLLLIATSGSYQQRSQTFTVQNRGVGDVGPLSWRIENVPAWLDLSATVGDLDAGQSVDITATADPAGRPFDIFNATLHIVAAGATHSPQELAVKFLYTGEPPVHLPIVT